MTIAIVYARVSSDRQDEERQVQDLRRVAAERGWEIVAEIRECMTGTRSDRPGLQRALALAKEGKTDVLLVWELSRLTRGGIGDLFDVVRVLDSAKVKLASVQEPWVSTDGPTRDLLLAVLGWAAKMERDLLSERTKSGLVHARALGKRVGRRPIITVDLLAEIRRLREGEGLRWSQVAVRVHHPSSSCRKWYSTLRAGKPRVINEVPGIGALSDAPLDTYPA